VNAARAVEEIPFLDHGEAMALAEAEYAHLLALTDELSPQEWQRATDCTGWSVRDILGHMLGIVGRCPAVRPEPDCSAPGFPSDATDLTTADHSRTGRGSCRMPTDGPPVGMPETSRRRTTPRAE
jgi:hypothetical protein